MALSEIGVGVSTSASVNNVSTAKNTYPFETQVDTTRGALERLIDSKDHQAIISFFSQENEHNLPADVRAALEKDGGLLHYAAAHGNGETTAALLESLPKSVNVRNPQDQTPLMVAAQKGNADVVEALLKASASPDDTDGHNGWTAMMWAAASNALEAVKALLGFDSSTLNLSITDKEGNDALMIAIKSGNTAVAKLLIKHIDVNAKNNHGETPVVLAVEAAMVGFLPDSTLRRELPTILSALVEKGANFNLHANDGSTALLRAVEKNDLDVVRALLSVKGVNINTANSQTGKSALFTAFEKKDRELIELLISEKANPSVDVKDKDGKTLNSLVKGDDKMFNLLVHARKVWPMMNM